MTSEFQDCHLSYNFAVCYTFTFLDFNTCVSLIGMNRGDMASHNAQFFTFGDHSPSNGLQTSFGGNKYNPKT